MPDVRDPLVQLERCHRRIEEACNALVAAARDHDIELASDALGFFDRQGKRHESDEESSVFPRLDAAASPAVKQAIDELRGEHRHHAALHERLAEIVAGRIDGDPWTALDEVARELGRAYASHIAKEESVLFPAVRAIFTDEDRAAIRAEMESRRGR